MYRNEVIIANRPFALNRPYDYLSENEYSFGQLVNVSFGHALTYGIIIASYPIDDNDRDIARLKMISSSINDYSFLTPLQYQLALDMAYQGFSGLGKILVQMIPNFLHAKQPFASFFTYDLTIDPMVVSSYPLTKGQRAIIDWLNQGHRDYSQAIDRFSKNRIDRLINQHVLIKSTQLPIPMDTTIKDGLTIDPIHIDHRKTLYQMDLSSFCHALLRSLLNHGLTIGGHILVITPSLVMMEQIYDDLSHSFDHLNRYDPALSIRDKKDGYYKLYYGQTIITIATKSVLLIKPDCTMMIILNCHDNGYLQDNDPRIHIDELIHIIDKAHHPWIIYQSMVPPLSLMHRLSAEAIDVIHAPSLIKPNVEFIPIVKKDPLFADLALSSLKLVDQWIEINKKIVITTSRKGWYYHSECKHCHHAKVCPRCDHLLQYDPTTRSFYCGYCDHTYTDVKCSQCGHDQWDHKKPGVKAIASLLASRYKDIKIMVNDASVDPYRCVTVFNGLDHGILVVDHRLLQQVMIDADALIMLHGDSALGYRQYKGDEWMMQQILSCCSQVDNDDHSCVYIIQLDHGDHHAIQFVKMLDYDGYIQYGLDYRKTMVLPPYSVIALIKMDHQFPFALLNRLTKLQPNDGYIIGPSDNRYDRSKRMIVRCNDRNHLLNWLNAWISDLSIKDRSHLSICIDPNQMPNE